MRKFTLLVAFAILISNSLFAQFTSLTRLDPISVSVSASTGEKPQSKVWTHAGKHWTVLPNKSGTHVWRLDGTTWTRVLTISSATNSKVDCKMDGAITHVLLFRGTSSQLVSIEYDSGTDTYKLWSARPSAVNISLSSGVETATLDLDGTGRMWIASDASTTINVKWSDYPYSSWSSPITIASGISSDDICRVVYITALQKLGVFWSNQNSERFGFKVHADGASPSTWSNDEVPASQSALNVGGGMADDHMNLTDGSDGTLYCAVKTSYNSSSQPLIALLVRRPNGSWDRLYQVSTKGTRPIVILNEVAGKVKVVFTSSDSGGNILYRESSTSTISFGSQLTLISGSYNNPTSTKDLYTSEVVVLASSSSQAVGVLGRDGSSGPTPPPAPVLLSPANNATNVSVSPTLSWNAASTATSYQLQVSTTSSFSSFIYNQSGITTTSAQVSGLTNDQQYYWRVRASNSAGPGNYSSVWNFRAEALPLQAPAVPTLVSPADNATNVPLPPTLSWNNVATAASYQAQVSTTSNFSNIVFDQSNITTNSVSATSLQSNTTYYWQVRATNSAGTSNWSASRSFTTLDVPPAPTLNSPADGATGVSGSPTLTWNTAATATSYQAQVSTSPTFSSPVFDQSGITNTSAAVSGLAANTTYYWQVRAENSAGKSNWSATWSFTTAVNTVPNSLVGHWQMDEAGGNILTDASTYGNNATTVNNPSRVTGVLGQALLLNGSNQYATAPDNGSLDISGPITISAWIRPTALKTQYILKKGLNNTTNGYELTLSSTGKIFFRFNEASSNDTYRLNSATSYPTNGSTWMHVAATYNGTVMKIYINGTENASKTFSNPPAISTNSVALGIGDQAGGEKPFHGALDDVRLYNVALTAGDISNLATNPSPRMAMSTFQQNQDELKAYPNPFQTTATLNFTLQTSGAYSLELYSNEGMPLKTLKQSYGEAGEQNTLTLDGTTLRPGLYIVRLQTPDGVKFLRVVLRNGSIFN